MKRGSTITLRAVVVLIGLLVLLLCIFVLPAGIMSDRAGGYRPLLLGMYVPAIPFYIGLYQGLKLLNYIDKNKVFSKESVKALKIIKFCAAIVCALYTAAMPYIFYLAQMDDAPGVALIGFIIVFGSLTVATAAAVFQSQLAKVVDIKSENDLTV